MIGKRHRKAIENEKKRGSREKKISIYVRGSPLKGSKKLPF